MENKMEGQQPKEQEPNNEENLNLLIFDLRQLRLKIAGLKDGIKEWEGKKELTDVIEKGIMERKLLIMEEELLNIKLKIGEVEKNYLEGAMRMLEEIDREILKFKEEEKGFFDPSIGNIRTSEIETKTGTETLKKLNNNKKSLELNMDTLTKMVKIILATIDSNSRRK